MNVWASIAAALVSGVLLWTALGPLDVGWVAWIALVPVALVSLRSGATRARRLAVPLAYAVCLELLVVPSLPFGLADDQWGEPVVPILVADSPAVFVAVVAIPVFAALLYALGFPRGHDALTRNGPALVAVAVLLPATAWTALDVVRTKYDPGGLWGPLYASQHDGAASQLAALAGPWLVTFAVAAVNYALALTLVRARRTTAVVAIVAAVAVPVAAEAAGSEERTITVAAVQPGYDTAEFDRPVLHYLRRAYRDLERASLDLIGDLAPLTRDAARQGALVVVWPEATVWVDPHENERVQDALASVARATDAILVVPYFLRSHGHGGAVIVDPRGGMTPPQPKQRPMWFLGEDGGKHAAARPVETAVGRIGTLLGVDNQDAGSARPLAARGAGLIVSSTHDWAALARQQRAFSQLHAAALDVPIVRADWRYGSAIFAAGGERIADAGLEKRRTVVVGDVRAGPGATVYARIGDVFGWACVAMAALVAAARLAGRLRGERAEAERPAHAVAQAQVGAQPPP